MGLTRLEKLEKRVEEAENKIVSLAAFASVLSQLISRFSISSDQKELEKIHEYIEEFLSYSEKIKKERKVQ